mmetsp:Transcript_15575/g.44286  ORF Transcript_15575/g.44286 Transcript_15575/m.44286 type:complete len:492 (+) Transcript_15575:519-1994(+)
MKEQAKAPQKGREHAKGQKDVKGPAAKDTASKEAVHEEEDWNRDKSKSHGVASSSRSREHSASPTRRPKHGLQRSSRSSSMSERRKMGHHHAGGGHPWDMESLKQAIMLADSGKGEVKSLITKSLFSPRAPAFTALINMCGKEKMAEKALEVFETSQELKIEKNTYMYSALISALGSSGLWQKAFEIFERMLQETSDICKPNTITYSALISACERAGQVEKALDVFERMKAAGIQPDLITYSVLLSVCEKDNLWETEMDIIDQMHTSSLHASPLNYSRVINALGERGMVDKAIEIFLQLQVAGKPVLFPSAAVESRGRQSLEISSFSFSLSFFPRDDVDIMRSLYLSFFLLLPTSYPGCEISLNLCNIMLNCFERNARGDLAYHLMRSMHENGIIGESITYNMILSSLSKSVDPGIMPLMLETYNNMKYFGARVTGYTCGLLISACEKFKDPHTALQLTHDFQQLNVPIDHPTLESLNKLLRTISQPQQPQ